MSDVVKANEGFTMRPYAFFQNEGGRKPTRAETILKGFLYSMSRGGRVCHCGYTGLAEKFHIRGQRKEQVVILANPPLFIDANNGFYHLFP